LLKSLLVFIAVYFLSTLPAQAQQPQQQQPEMRQTPVPDQSNLDQSNPGEPGQIICAGNIPPEGTIITATGNSVECGGSCRARRIEQVHGHIMVICAQQPVPDNYEIQSLTSTPACNCLGEEDNAYVIRAVTGTLPTPNAVRGGSAERSGSF
ncbi:MAG TPA: hypothetical protein VN867_13540, partial [Candidatus Binataceae bacterium]|nr:hypothetical protein [Candidatus Binataceae bacterium]